jgi:hypothetical protein
MLWTVSNFTSNNTRTEMTDKEWETALKYINEKTKKWVDIEIAKIKLQLLMELIENDLKND